MFGESLILLDRFILGFGKFLFKESRHFLLDIEAELERRFGKYVGFGWLLLGEWVKGSIKQRIFVLV